MANRTYTLSEKVNQLLQYKTQKQAAAILGVSDRTIRRWKSGRVTKPARHSAPAVKRLSKRATYYRGVSRKHGAPQSLAVAPPVAEVAVKNAPMSTHADVKKLKTDSIVDYVSAATKQGEWVRFLVSVPKSAEYPKGVLSTHWFNFRGASDAVVQREVEKVGHIKKVISTKPK